MKNARAKSRGRLTHAKQSPAEGQLSAGPKYRRSWGTVRPVTKVKPSAKVYSRAKHKEVSMMKP